MGFIAQRSFERICFAQTNLYNRLQDLIRPFSLEIGGEGRRQAG